MADELNLSVGDPSVADESSPRRRRRRERNQDDTRNTSNSDNLLGEIQSGLDRVFQQLAEWREKREDDELATAIREEQETMVKGIMLPATRFPFLRLPVVIFVNVVSPLLSFGRVGRILTLRWYARRAQADAQLEHAAEQAGMTPQEFVDRGLDKSPVAMG